MLINEIFYSLQGEGFYTGRAAVFVRFSGCNMHCCFCDTMHESGIEMTEEEILEAVMAYSAKMVVVTGGEPAMQLTASLVEKLHSKDRYVAVETNGTIALPDNVDWITLSPKDAWNGKSAAPVLTRVDEVKLLFDGEHEPEPYLGIKADYYFLQPMDTGDQVRNKYITSAAVDYIKGHPNWRLSLQIHKLLDIK